MDTQDKDFLVWLSNRLVYKHGYKEDDAVVSKLIQLSESDCISSISDEELDLIISKYYADFFLDKADDIGFGYTDIEREDIRKKIRSLVYDINNKNIPLNTIK